MFTRALHRLFFIFMILLIPATLGLSLILYTPAYESWEGDLRSCNGCISCCDQLGCIFLDRKNRQCAVYGSFFWKYFNCGRYHSNQFQIDYYGCPKWKMKEL